MPQVYSTDMTMLISAASRAEVDDQHTLINPHSTSDPESSQSFECLSTIACNDTRIFFREPEHLYYHSPFVKTWLQVAAQYASNLAVGQVLPPIEGERFRVMLEPFANWLFEHAPDTSSNADKLARWMAFQFSRPELMQQFWHHNNLVDLQQALKALKDHPLTGGLAEAIRSEGVRTDEVSRSFISTMDDVDYALAYGFWAFAKGFRFSASIPNGSIYAVHWLRENALTAGVTVESTTESRAFQKLFPWGVVLNGLPEWKSLSHSSDDMAPLILGLRAFTAKELPGLGVKVATARDFQHIRDFIQDGLRASLPLDKYERVDCDLLAQIVGIILMVAGGLEGHRMVAGALGGQLVLEVFGGVLELASKLRLPPSWFAVATDPVRRTVRRLRYPRSVVQLSRKHEKSIRAFCEAHGWI